MPMPFSPCDPSATSCPDQSIGVLRHIFGPVIDTLVQGGDPNTVQASTNILASMFSVFNSGILIVGSLIVSYVALMGVANTANDGEAMGKGWSSVWTPVRIVAGGSVLLPTTSGYSFIQIVVLMFSLWGVGFSNSVYREGMTMGILSPDGIVQGVNQPGNFYGLRDFARQYLAASYCAKAANAIYSGSTADGAVGSTGGSASPNVQARPDSWDKQIVSGGSTDYTFYVMDRNASTNLAGGEPFCGTVNISQYAAQTDNVTDQIVVAMEQLHARAQAQKVATVGSMMTAIDQWVATWPNTIDDDGWDKVDSDQFNQIVSNAENQVATNLANSITNGEAGVDSGIKNFADSLTGDGWAAAGGWFQRVGMIRGQISSVLAAPVGTVTSPSLSALPPDSRAARLMNSVTTVTEAINKKSEEKSSYGASSVKPDDIASLIPKDPKSDINPMSIKASMDAKMGSFVNNTMHTIVDAATGAGGNGQTPLCGTAGQMGGSLNRMKCIGDYITVARSSLMAADFTIKSAVTVLRVGAGTLSSVKGVGTGLDLDKIATPLWDWIIEVPSKQIAMLMTYMEPLAFYFGIFLPSLPYTLYMIVVVGWFLAVFQSTLASCLWAVMHMTPDRTFIGSQSQGYLLLLSLFARPALAVIGLFGSILISDPIIDYIANGFFAIRGAVVTSTGGVGAVVEFLTFAQWFQMFGLVLLPVLYMVYGLPQVLPDHVLQWIGAGISDMGATGALAEMRGGIAGMGRGIGGSGGGPRRLGGGGAPRFPGGGGGGGDGEGGARGGGGQRRLGYEGGDANSPGNKLISTNSQGVADRSGAAPVGGGAGVRDGGPQPGGNRDTRRFGEKLGEGFGMAVGRGATLGAAAVGRSAARMGGALVSGGRGALGRAASASKDDIAKAMSQAGRDGAAAFTRGADTRLGAVQRSKQIQAAAGRGDAINGGSGRGVGGGAAPAVAGTQQGSQSTPGSAPASSSAQAPERGPSGGGDLVGGGSSSVAGARGQRSRGDRSPPRAQAAGDATPKTTQGDSGQSTAQGNAVMSTGRGNTPGPRVEHRQGDTGGPRQAAPASTRGRPASSAGGAPGRPAPPPVGEGARQAPVATEAPSKDGNSTVGAGRQAQPSAVPPPRSES